MLLSVIRKVLAAVGVSAQPAAPAIWRGIHRDFAEIPGRGPGYAAESLIAETAEFTSALAAGSVNTLPTHLACEQTLLALHLASRATRPTRLRVLDFGGGMGVGYFSLRSCLDHHIPVDYYVVENRAMCARAAGLFADHGSLRFCEDFPSGVGALDVVYVSSALQYVDDWRAVITKLCSYRAPFVFFVKLSAGTIPTYTTEQVNLTGMVVPYRFLNVHELIGAMRDQGYALVFRGLLDRIYEQNDFPATHRLGRACNLLFSLEKTGDQP
ncbi:MAG: methyltransferase, TIGR04325 family [Betaproteobacteria bacterium]|nr:methyltransferase, TIGR04325 family [Betaproteobacteria bacterium]